MLVMRRYSRFEEGDRAMLGLVAASGLIDVEDGLESCLGALVCALGSFGALVDSRAQWRRRLEWLAGSCWCKR